MGMESEISPERCVCPVGEFDPSNYGFSKESTGKRPQEFFVT